MEPLKKPPCFILTEIFSVCQKLVMSAVDIKELDLTKNQICVLFALMHHPYLSMSRLADYIPSSKEQATRAVAPLAQAHYVERFQDEKNRKLVLIRLTEKGRDFIFQTLDSVDEKLCEKAAALSEEDIKRFQEALDTTLEILKKLDQ
ncbi:winged helix DNA-binding protein [Anaerovorax odorimutans]|uniref:Winged helix DNA-binding protein n=1 Tax=Anaerovorax odorimutans TaxID=109327 RepID=A0ABT1RSH3_9FIRM|nr:winged helix DNA-binding protein [Anaerovorax odorimutans]MCQ4638158.1 winged helix DNA-binding protein [Anaerovorax odorimutans]